MAPTKTILALDVGNKRIGLSTASLVAKLPNPNGVIVNDEHVFTKLVRYIKDNQTVAVVVGLPRGLEGQETAQTKLVRQFAEELKKHLQIPVYLQDEALTSKQAEAELNAKGLYNKEAVDALAATYILNDFLSEYPEF